MNRRRVLIETSWNVKNRMRITADKITPVLIETSWNVKIPEPDEKVHKHWGINRNIVECKGKKEITWKHRKAVLIETSWNVKTCKFSIRTHYASVLIETSWNVKMHSWLLVLHGWSVLIETSWNVKEERPVLRQSLLHSINRNIVECKGR